VSSIITWKKLSICQGECAYDWPTGSSQNSQRVGALLYSSTGAIGISQVISNGLKTGWDKKEFSGPPPEVMDKIGKKLVQLLGPYLQAATWTHSLVGDASASLCKSLVAIPVQHTPCLFSFDYNGAPEQTSAELPFIAMGSGQPIADPFLALLKRLLWQNTQPTLAEGRFAATWTIDHVRLVNPGGVGGKIQLATLATNPGKQPTLSMLSEEDIQEHLVQIRAAEQALVMELRRPAQAGGTDAVPPTPSR
jgi:hypothetical protein